MPEDYLGARAQDGRNVACLAVYHTAIPNATFAWLALSCTIASEDV